ncbi:transposase domain-containing protein [Agathobacter rectalis]|uniref:transposase domain-containing protein n=1 Tax=Agathobacter rectalis TaxID=39491 RepID=UPI0027D2536A
MIIIEDYYLQTFLHSLETALLNGIKPYLYLTYILDEIPKMRPFPKADELDSLLPWSDQLPEGFRTELKK